MKPETNEQETSHPTVLIVEDEPAVATMYQRFLQRDYEVRIASNGAQALDTLSPDIDIVLLDRMMPDMSGDAVLEQIRARALDCRVVMVSAVEPDFDIINMGFDAYVQKPPTRDQLKEVVAEMLSLSAYEDDLQAYFSALKKQRLLTDRFDASALEENEEYVQLSSTIDRLHERIHGDTDRFADDFGFVSAIDDIAAPKQASSHDGR
ncbi:response regulator [Haladaptatus sp. DJG-WS-42]|uniref:response regulator n=1 Tax=Haladaptatus sp. DJG-WS-42 TaxID=3120516 RepID=UPI0030D48F9E